MLKLFLIYLFSLVHVLSQILINQTSLISFQLQDQDSPDLLKMYPSGQKVLLFYPDGSIRCIDFQTKDFQIWDAHRIQIVGVQWIPGHGPITLDKSGLAIRWNQAGVPQYKWKLSNNPKDMSITIDRSGMYFVAFNLQNQIQEYKALENANQTTLVIKQGNALYNKIQYDKSHNFLFTFQYRLVAPLYRSLRKYGCFDGQLLAQKKMVYSPSSLDSYSKTQILMNSIDVDIVDYNLSTSMIYSATQPISMLKVYGNGLVLILQKQGIITILNGTQVQQNFIINSFIKNVRKIDCNQQYLAILGSNSADKKVIMVFKFYDSNLSPDPQDELQKTLQIILVIFGILAMIVIAILGYKKCSKKDEFKQKESEKSLLINKSQFE